MSGDIISVSPDEVLTVAQQFSQKKDELEGIMQQVRTQIGTMTSWRGAAQVNFMTVMDAWNREIANVHQTLDEVTMQLKQFETQMRTVDTSTRF